MSARNFLSKPSKSLQGEISVPGDKSISHRSIIFGSIAQGTSIVNGFLNGEDCIATLKAFQNMGVTIEHDEGKEQLLIHGVGKYGLKKPKTTLDCGNSGTSMRLLAGLLAAQSFDSELTGDQSLRNRPMQRISKPLIQMGANLNTHEGKAPILIKGGVKLKGIHYEMPEASAQVKSCILLAGMYADGVTSVSETGISRDHTERMLKTFLYPFEQSSNKLQISNKGECVATNINIPGDISSAAFFIVAATIIPDSDVLIRNVGINPTRTGILDILKAMGANISLLNQRNYGEEPVADLHICSARLKGIDIPSNLVPLAIDEFPIIFIAAACAEGSTTLRGAKELRVKESDRIAVMVEGLVRLGIAAEELEDGLIIQGGTLQGGEVKSNGDHRIAMSFAIAGAAAQNPVLVRDCVNVATSFPNFVSMANSLFLQIEGSIENER